MTRLRSRGFARTAWVAPAVVAPLVALAVPAVAQDDSTPFATPLAVQARDDVRTLLDPPGATDWDTPGSSTRQSPREIVGDAFGGSLASAGAQTSPITVLAMRKQGGEPVLVSRSVVGVAAAQAEVARQQADPSVLSVGINLKRRLVDDVPPTTGTSGKTSAINCYDPAAAGPQWDVTALGINQVLSQGITGAGVKVAVIDSGTNGNHPDLKGQVLTGADYVSGGNGWNDQVGHGTHVGGTIAALNNGSGVLGFAPGAKILPVRVADGTGFALDADTIAGIKYSVSKGVQVINMSLAGPYSGPLETATKYALSKNILVVAAAGNYRDQGNPVSYPAATPGVLAVAATAQDRSVAYFSESGTYVRIAAPGVAVLGTFPVTSTYPSGYCLMSGTSMASPHVAAIGALLYQASGGKVRGATAVAAMIGTASDANTSGYDKLAGFGIVDPVAAVATAKCWTAGTCYMPLPNVRANSMQRYVQRAYVHLSGAGPSTTDLLNWVYWINSNSKTPISMTYPRTSTAGYRARAAQTYMWSALRRTGPASSVTYYGGLLAKGYSQQQLYATLLASSESYSKAGGTNAAWVRKVYTEALGYPAPDSSVAYWTKVLAQGTSRQTVALRLVRTDPSLGRIVDYQYLRYLQRKPTADARATWVKALKGTTRVEYLSAALVASQEYRAKS